MAKITLTKDKVVQPLVKRNQGEELTIEQFSVIDFMGMALSYKLEFCNNDILKYSEMTQPEKNNFDQGIAKFQADIESYEARR